MSLPLKVSCSVVSNSLLPHGLYSPPGSSVHGAFQARGLEWVPFPPPGVFPDPGIKPAFPALQADSLPPGPSCPDVKCFDPRSEDSYMQEQTNKHNKENILIPTLKQWKNPPN